MNNKTMVITSKIDGRTTVDSSFLLNAKRNGKEWNYWTQLTDWILFWWDGDFRPKFTTSEETKTKYGYRNTSKIPDVVFDAK